MDPKMIRKLLGLAETASDDEVNKKLGARFAEADEAVKKTSALSQERDNVVKGMEAAGFKLEGGKFVKLAQDEQHKDETEREKALRLQLEESRFNTGKQRVETATQLAQAFTGAGGKIPPAMKGNLEKLFSIAGKSETLALSQDGTAVVASAFDAVAALKEVLNSVVPMTKESLLQLAQSTKDEEKDEKKTLREKGRSMSAAVKPKKAGASK